MAWDNIGIGILTGTDPFMGSDADIKAAVAKRFEAIKDKLVRRDGDYLYTGNRCAPESLGWRMLQNQFDMKGRPSPLPHEILEGKHDADIEAAWHDAASAEHYYTYEKDWGYGPGMGAFGHDSG